MATQLVPLDLSVERDWRAILTGALVDVKFPPSLALSYSVCDVAGGNSKPETPRPPLLIPVIRPTQEQLDEHGYFGRYNVQRNREMAEAVKANVPTFEEEEGLPANNGVFNFERFGLLSHFDVSGLFFSDAIQGMPKDFPVVSEKLDWETMNISAEKILEVSEGVRKAAGRVGFDISNIDKKQWAAIFQHAESLVIGSVHLERYQFNIVAGLWDCKWASGRISPFPILHSLASQKNTRPISEAKPLADDAPSAVYLEAFERS